MDNVSLFKAAVIGSSACAVIGGVLLKALHVFTVIAYQAYQYF